jgi:hypothetical protein
MFARIAPSSLARAVTSVVAGSIISVLPACGGAVHGEASPGSDGGATGTSSGGSSAPDGTSSGGGVGGASGGSGFSGAGVSATCVVGTRGCLCDSTGGCAPGLSCAPQGSSRPPLCCSGSDCTAAAGGSIGGTCGAASGAASCTPGITIPAGAGRTGTGPAATGPGGGGSSATDSCGYPASSFAESSVLCGIQAEGGGDKPAVVRVFYDDEHALTLGCATSTDPVSALPSDPGAVSYPQTGDPSCVDSVGRPLRPVLFVTDITADATCTAGDLQSGGHPYDPVAVFGTWKSATEGAGNVGTPDQDPAANTWSLGAAADPVPTSASTACREGYGAELRFEVGLLSGHSYRLQVVVHDGDQNKGGDSGEACAIFCAGTGRSCGEGVSACTSETQCSSGTSCTQGCCLPPTSPPDASSSGGFLP